MTINKCYIAANSSGMILYSTIIQGYENGGLKMIDIDAFLNSVKASWVKRIGTKTEAKWNVLYNKELSKHGYDIFKCNISKTDANKLNLTIHF